MRNIFLFIRRFFNFFIFLVLQGICFGMLVNYNKSYQAFFASNASELTGTLDKQYNSIEYYFRLKATNDQLARENAALKNKLFSLEKGLDTTAILKTDSTLVDSTWQYQQFYFLPARVVSNDLTDENNYITLQRGSKQGVRKDMAVTGPDGIVGRVIFVSPNFSRVMSLLNHYSKVSVSLKNNSYNGIVDWDGKNAGVLLMHNVPKSASIQKGDTVVTSTLSESFPPGLMVGTVLSVASTDQASNFYTIKVKSATNFYTLQYAYVIGDRMLAEKKDLEARTPKN